MLQRYDNNGRELSNDAIPMEFEIYKATDVEALERRVKRLEKLKQEARQIITAKGSYDATIDPRIILEYETAYTFIGRLAAEPKE